MTKSSERLAKRPPPRREALLEAAAELFFEQGYAATSIDAIIERVGGSKRNVYNAFGNKEGLFSALVTSTADRALSALEVQAEGRDLEQVLTDFGTRLVGIYMSPTLVGIYRTVVAESGRFPDLARRFFDDGPGRAARGLAQVLGAARSRGEIGAVDPELAAEQFVAMMRDNVHLAVVLGLRPAPGEADIRRSVASAVAIFLRGARAITAN